MNKVKQMIASVAAGMTLLNGMSPVAKAEDTKPEASIVIQGYEFGPSVPKVVLKLPFQVTDIMSDEVKVVTAEEERKVVDVYLSDVKGKRIKEDAQSDYVTLELEVQYVEDKMMSPGTPFHFNLDKFHNEWVKEYVVSVQNLNVVKESGDVVTVDFKDDVLANKFVEETDLFDVRRTFTGEYVNPFTNQMEDVKLEYAAYEPETLSDIAKNPLVIWLHGQGEGGTDIEIALLGNEVNALVRPEIQKQFTSSETEQKGAYVLVVQTPTYWMDEGDGTNGAGAGVSRYTQAAMDLIQQYVESNPDIDTDRIYLAGCSNGGYMTLNLAIENPDYFAALAPLAPAYSYYQYDRNDDGSYKKSTESGVGKSVFNTNGEVWFDDAKVEVLKETPIWFVHAANDTIVDGSKYVLPIYKALIDSGATNKWLSYYESVKGVDIPNTEYMGHWSWLYFFNNQVSGVQNVEQVKSKTDLEGFAPSDTTQGGDSKAQQDEKEFATIFEWLNAQSLKSR